MCGGAHLGMLSPAPAGLPSGASPFQYMSLRPPWGQVFKGQTWVSDLPEAGAALGALRAGLRVAGLEGRGEGTSGEGRGEGRPGSGSKQGGLAPRGPVLCPPRGPRI